MPKSNQKPIKTKQNIYLDYAASALPNPSSVHFLGMMTKNKLQNARKNVAMFLNARMDEVIFTSGGTESNNLAIQGVVYSCQGKNVPHIITTNIEHPSVLETFKILENRGVAQISVIPVEKNGIVDPKKIKKEIKNNTVLVSVMYANNEIGTVQPIREISKEIRYHRKNSNTTFPLFHTDAVQAVNYLDLNVEKLGVDLLSFSGAKIENAGRVGVLYKRSSVSLANIFGGGDQEQGLRPGTENWMAIVQFAKALQIVQDTKEKETVRLIKLRDYFINKLFKMSFTVVVNGDTKSRLPNNVNVSFPKIPSDLLVIELSTKGIMTSAKSACKSSEKGSSYVVKAVNPNLGDDIGGLRFSFGKKTNKKDIDAAIKALSLILTKLKKWYS